MINLEEAINLLKTKYPDEKPYSCIEFKTKFAFSFPDGGSVVRIVDKKTGTISIESGLTLDLTKDVVNLYEL